MMDIETTAKDLQAESGPTLEEAMALVAKALDPTPTIAAITRWVHADQTPEYRRAIRWLNFWKMTRRGGRRKRLSVAYKAAFAPTIMEQQRAILDVL